MLRVRSPAQVAIQKTLDVQSLVRPSIAVLGDLGTTDWTFCEPEGEIEQARAREKGSE